MKKHGKTILTLAICSVLTFILIVVCGLSVYALYFSDDSNKEGSLNKELLKGTSSIQSEDNEILENKEVIGKDIQKVENSIEKEKNIEENSKTDDDSNIESTNNETNNKNVNEKVGSTNEKTKSYTANDGKIYEIIGTVEIPTFDIKYPILSTCTEELLKVSVTKYWGGYPNEVGNLCILGHNYKNSKFFSKLPNISKNEIIKVTDLSGRTLNYKVYETGIIEPEDTACTSQLTDGHTEVTLITCYYENGELHASKRFYAKARAI